MSSRLAALILPLALGLPAGAGCGPDVIVHEEALRRAAPATVAVLPFAIAFEDAGERAEAKVAALRGAFHRRFTALPYLHLETRATDRLLRRAGLDDPRKVARASHREIAAALGVDAYVRGEVESLSNTEAGVIYRQVIRASVRLVDARTGDELARVEHTEQDVGGVLVGSGQLLEAIRQTIDNSSDIGFLRLAERFADSVVQVFPKPPVAPAVVPPRIEDVRIIAAGEAGRTLRAGDTVEVVLRADPGLRASFDLGRKPAEVPLFEEAPGRYRGFYRVVPGDRSDGPATVHVSDRFGATALTVLREQTIRIDAPAGDLALDAARSEDGGRTR